MISLNYLRQFRIGGIAIFDLVVSYVGIYFLAPLLSKITKKIGLKIGRKEWLWLAIPIGVLTHLLVGQKTALNEILFNSQNYPIKITLILMTVIGLKGIKKINNSKKNNVINGQKITKQNYEDSKIVESYIQKNAGTVDSSNSELADKFAKYTEGKKILDLGCGPGHYSYLFAKKGFSATGLDYSKEMIRRAKTLEKSTNQPLFLVGNMQKLPEYFEENSFDGVWAKASLLHIPKKEIDSVLMGIKKITNKNSPILITLKQGSGTEIVKENHLDEEIIREYILWEKDEFISKAKQFGFELIDFSTKQGRVFLDKPTVWLQMIFRLKR